MYVCVLCTCSLVAVDHWLTIWSLQLFNIFVRERVSAFVKFYEENKSFVDDLGKCRVSVHVLIFFFLCVCVEGGGGGGNMNWFVYVR